MKRDHKPNKVATRELGKILKLRGKGLTFGDISIIVKEQYKKDISPQGIKYLVDNFKKVNP